MANGDCPVGARNAANVENLTKAIDTLCGRVEHMESRLSDVETTQKLQTANLDTGSKIFIGLMAALGPLLVVLLQWLLR